MTNIEMVKACVHANSRYGAEELLQRLSIENAVTLAAIADALERIKDITLERIARETERGDG